MPSHVPVWFERKFEFTFPVEQYPNLCIRLRGTPARMDELLRDVPHAVLTDRQDGTWSAQEQAGHLLDLEPLWAARVDDFLTEGETLTAADLRNRKTDEAHHNHRPLSEILTGFRTARLRMLDRVSTLQPDLFTRSKLHPWLKQPMRLVDHLYFVAEHDDHHLARIFELISTRSRT